MAAGAVCLADTKRLGRELHTSRSNAKHVAALLSILCPNLEDESEGLDGVSSAPTECRLEALRSLQAFFCPLLRSGKLLAAARKKAQVDIDAGGKDGQAEAIYRLWVWNNYKDFRKALFRIMAQGGNARMLQVAAVNTLMDLICDEKSGEFNNSLYLKICARMVASNGQSNEILQVLVAKHFKYRDVRCFTYGNLEKLIVKRLGMRQRDSDMLSSDDEEKQELAGDSLHTFVRNVYDVLLHLPPPSKGEENDADADASSDLWSKSFGSLKMEKVAAEKDGRKRKSMDNTSTPDNKLSKGKVSKKERFLLSKAWLSFLRLPLPLDVYKKVLARLHKSVIPHMTNPILLSDFLTQSYNTGGLISVMALSSLFVLITKHGLEYPDFYNKLYALLEPSLFVAKYRSRFFELLDTCLHSPHLPGYLGAAFAKRLGRLVLSAPPSGAIVVIALIHNLLRRHPSINVLVHQPTSNAATAAKMDSAIGPIEESPSNLEESLQLGICERASKEHPGIDPFIASEADISKCNALKSSLWEVETLRRHYCPAVSRFVESLEADLTVRAKTTEVSIRDFSSASYATIFEEEVGRRLKSVPLAFYSTVPGTLFPGNNLDGSFEGWKFTDSSDVHMEGLDTADRAHGNFNLEGARKSMHEAGEEGFSADASSDEASSDGSGGSRSRSEESEGDGWPQSMLKRLISA